YIVSAELHIGSHPDLFSVGAVNFIPDNPSVFGRATSIYGYVNIGYRVAGHIYRNKFPHGHIIVYSAGMSGIYHQFVRMSGFWLQGFTALFDLYKKLASGYQWLGM